MNYATGGIIWACTKILLSAGTYTQTYTLRSYARFIPMLKVIKRDLVQRSKLWEGGIYAIVTPHTQIKRDSVQ